MPRFEPFRGIRYDTVRHDLALVTAPPYDVLSEADRDELAARHPHNVVLVDVPLEREGPGRYDAAGERFRAWLAEGVLVTDPEPAYYLHRMSFLDELGRPRQTAGVVGALEVREPGEGVLPHEQTTPKARTDRLELTHATLANLSPVWGLSLSPDLAPLLTESGDLLAEFTADDGVTHRLERVENPTRVEAIQAAVAGAEVVVADGHHRYEIARRYRSERRAAGGDRPGPYDLTLTFVVPLVADQLHVQAIHRLVSDVAAGFDLPRALDPFFERVPAGAVTVDFAHRIVEEAALCLVHADGTGELLRPRPEAFAGVRDLDSARLQHALAAVPHEIRYQHGVDQVLTALAAGEAQWGVLLRPVTVADIEATAHQRVLMPPKSTFFAPKPRTGLLFRSLA